MNRVLSMQRRSDMAVKKGKAFESEIPKRMEGHSRKRKHKVHVGAIKMRLWPSFML